MKKVLILSGDTGQGHNSCAQAIQAYFGARLVPCEVRDGLAFISPRVSRLISWGHRTVYRYFPGLFRWGYRFVENHPGLIAEKSLICRILAGGAEPLRRYIQDGGFDTVICTHIFAAITLTDMMHREALPIQTALLATDYTCSPGVNATDMQWYFIPGVGLTEDFTAVGIPEERIVPSGIPVRQEFFRAVEKTDAKRLLGIPPAHRHLLVSCGSMGCGHMRAIVHHLSKEMPEDMDISVICGTNARLVRQLKRRYRGNERIHILGYTHDMPVYMDAAELYLTKPGGITVTEAAAKGLPMVLNNEVAGCEDYNGRFFISRAVARTASSSRGLAEQCVKLLYDDEALERMRLALRGIGACDARHIWAALGGEEEENED